MAEEGTLRLKSEQERASSPAGDFDKPHKGRLSRWWCLGACSCCRAAMDNEAQAWAGCGRESSVGAGTKYNRRHKYLTDIFGYLRSDSSAFNRCLLKVVKLWATVRQLASCLPQHPRLLFRNS